jgi:hypothetical protein
MLLQHLLKVQSLVRVLILRRVKQSKSKKTTKKKRTSAQQMRDNIRLSDDWWFMRQRLMEEQKIDPVTQSKLTVRANCHHLDQRDENYNKLIDKRFIMLNPRTHKFIHFIYPAYKKYGEQVLVALRDILDKMIEYSND